jgi:hypothetical protein
MKRNQTIGAIIGVVVIAGGAFYAGTVYGRGQTPGRGNFANGGTFMVRNMGGARGTAGFVAGSIVSADNGSISIKMQNGSSTQLVLIGANTQVLKSVEGSASDLTVGTDVTITGTPNSDGSLTASSIQIRPAGARFPGGRTTTSTAQ